MIRNQYIKHPKSGVFNLLSLLFERISFFGVRSVLVIYLIQGIFQYPRSQSIETFAIFITSIFFASIAGGLLGDRVFGNRNAVLYGGIIKALGVFIVSVPSETALFAGLALIVTGGALYSPNLLANIGRSYLSRSHLMDSGFTISLGIQTIGALIGTLLMTYIMEFSFTWAFLVAGTMMIISTFLVLINKNDRPEPTTQAEKPKTNKTRSILLIMLAFGVFYTFYRIFGVPQESIKIGFVDGEAQLVPGFIRSNLDFAVEIIVIASLALFWTFYRYSRKVKLLIAAVSVLISSVFILFIPSEDLTYIHLVLFIIHLLLMTFAHFQVEPIIYSLIMKYGNPKYYATLLILIKIPPSFLHTLLYAFIIGQLSSYDTISHYYTVAHVAIGMIGMSIYAGIVYFFMKFIDNDESYHPEKERKSDNILLDA